MVKMTRRTPAIVMEISKNGIENLTICAERDPKCQQEAAQFYANITNELLLLDKAVRSGKRKIVQ